MHSYLFHKPYLDLILPIALEGVYTSALAYNYLHLIENYDISLPDCYARFTNAHPLQLMAQIMCSSQSLDQFVSFVLKYAYPMLFRPKVNFGGRRFVCLDPYVLIDLDKNVYHRLEDIAKLPENCYMVDAYHCTEDVVYRYFPEKCTVVSVRQSLLFFLNSFEYLAYDLEFIGQLLHAYEVMREQRYETSSVSKLDLSAHVTERPKDVRINTIDVNKLPRDDISQIYDHLVSSIRVPVKLATFQRNACDGFTVEVILVSHYGSETMDMLRKILPMLKEKVCAKVQQAPFLRKNPDLIPFLYVAKVEMSAHYICTFTVLFKGNTDYGKYAL